MENITANEQIAVFIGFKFAFERGHRIYNVPKEYLFQVQAPKCSNVKFNFDTSFDWLMPVVEKITRHVYDEDVLDNVVIKETAFLRTFGMVSPEGKQMVRFNRCALFEADTLIEATYQAVVDWIRQYNNLTRDSR